MPSEGKNRLASFAVAMAVNYKKILQFDNFISQLGENVLLERGSNHTTSIMLDNLPVLVDKILFKIPACL